MFTLVGKVAVSPAREQENGSETSADDKQNEFSPPGHESILCGRRAMRNLEGGQ
jgi:hypothetical protein